LKFEEVGGGRLHAEIDLPDTVVRGRVIDEEGQPVADAIVRVRPLNLEDHTVDTTVDSEGRYPRYVFSDFVLSPSRRSLLKSGREVPLIPRYFDLLVLILERRSQAVPAGDLRRRVERRGRLRRHPEPGGANAPSRAR